MNNTETIQLLGNNYPKEHIKYSYVGKKMRYKKYLKYLGIFQLVITGISWYVGQQFISLIVSSPSPALSTTPFSNELLNQHRVTLDNLVSVLRITAFIQISLIVAFIILLIPRINCLFLKIEGIKKDIILYKSIHKDEVALIANEINTKIKENNFLSFPY